MYILLGVFLLYRLIQISPLLRKQALVRYVLVSDTLTAEIWGEAHIMTSHELEIAQKYMGSFERVVHEGTPPDKDYDVSSQTYIEKLFFRLYSMFGKVFILRLLSLTVKRSDKHYMDSVKDSLPLENYTRINTSGFMFGVMMFVLLLVSLILILMNYFYSIFDGHDTLFKIIFPSLALLVIFVKNYHFVWKRNRTIAQSIMRYLEEEQTSILFGMGKGHALGVLRILRRKGYVFTKKSF